MSGMIVSRATRGRLPLELAQIEDAAVARWGDHVHARRSTVVTNSALTLDVTPPGEPEFTIDVMADLESVNMDGTPEQNYDTAAWLRSLMPQDTPRVIVYDGAWTTHSELTHGATGDSLRHAAIKHDTPGWNANDPDLQ